MKKYLYLRQKLSEFDIDDDYLSEHLGISTKSIQRRFANVPGCSWNLGEMYKVMDMVGEGYNRLHIVFPKGGVVDKKVALDIEQLTISQLLQKMVNT